MEALEIKYLTETKLKELDKIGNREFDSKDILDACNEAQVSIVMETYIASREDEVAKRILENITKDFKTTTIPEIASENLEYGHFIELPADFWFALEESAIVTYNGIDNFSMVKPIIYDYYTINKENPYKQPYKELTWRLTIGKQAKTVEFPVQRHELITASGCTIKEYKMRYLAQLPDISFSSNTTSVISDSLHFDLVNRAVAILVIRLGVAPQPTIKE